MKTFKLQAAQGDLMIRKVNKIPENLKQINKQEEYVVAHSETGHHHVLLGNVALMEKDEFIKFVEVKEEARLEHRRSFDTHETIIIAPGLYELRRQREHTPEGFRMVMD